MVSTKVILLFALIAFVQSQTNVTQLKADVMAFPNQTNTTITGTVTVTQNSDATNTTLSLNLNGFSMVCNCSGAACDNSTTPANANFSCTVSINSGTNCSDSANVQGHYFGSPATTDPWNGANGAVYNTSTDTPANTDMDVTLMTSYGYNLTETVGKIFVITDSDANKVGCGVFVDDSMSSRSFTFGLIGFILLAILRLK